jgi:hypothetical protein
MKIGWFLLATASAWAQPTFSAPQLGYIRNGGDIHRVVGLAGNFILSEATTTAVISSAFSSSLGFLKTRSQLVSLDSQNQVVSTHEAPGGPALVSFLAGPSALVYFPASRSLYRWSGGHLDSLPFDASQLGGEALSMAGLDSDTAAFLLRRDDGLWLIQIILSSGVLRSSQALPGVTAPALLLTDGSLLFTDPGDLVLRLVSGTETRYPLGAAVDSMEPMNDGWIHVRTRNLLHFALRLPAQDDGRLYALPLPSPIGR